MRILVIEDEPELARTIAQALEESGFAADTALDGEKGLVLAQAHPYDALVLDLLLPKRHGLSVLREIRRTKPTLPVLLLTALDRTDEKVDGLSKGADDYLAKPFALRELLARVRALLRRGREDVVPGALVRLGGLEVDLAAGTVKRHDAPLKLTPREYARLVFFVHRRGEAVSRTEIGEHVIDRNFEATSNLLDVSIGNLRAKLGEPSLLETIRGIGYRFGEPAP